MPVGQQEEQNDRTEEEEEERENNSCTAWAEHCHQSVLKKKNKSGPRRVVHRWLVYFIKLQVILVTK